MIHDEEQDLSWADSAPVWVENIGPLMELWGNPVFQRRYVVRRLRPTFGARRAFQIGLAASFILNLFFIFVADKDMLLVLAFGVTVAFPSILATSITSVRLFTSCLVGTPLELRRELYSGMLGSVLATPIPDARIFFAEIVSGIMRGLGAMEEVLALAGGLMVPFLVLMSPQLLEIVKGIGIQSIWWLVLIVMVLGIIVILNVMTAFAAGLYSIMLPVSVTLPTTLIHVGGIFFGSLLCVFWILGLLFRMEGMAEPDPLLVLLSVATFLIVVFTLFTSLTGHLGVLAFAKARRPGYYEPDRVSAAGLLMRDKGSDVSFGQRV